MNKIASILVLALFFSVTLSQAVAAQNVPDTFQELAELTVDLPLFGDSDKTSFPVWNVVAISIMLGMVFKISLKRVWKDVPNLGWIATAIVFLVLGNSNTAANIMVILGLASFGLNILLFVLFGMLVVFILNWIGAKNTTGAISGRISGADKAVGKLIGGDEQKEAQEKQLLQELERIESAGISQAEHIRQYLEEVNRLLANPELLKDNGLRQKLSSMLNNLRDSARRLNLDTSAIAKVKANMDSALSEHKMLLRRKLEAEFKALNTAGHIGGGMAFNAARVNIQNHLNTLETELKTDLNVDARINAVETSLAGAHGLAAILTAQLNAGITSLRAGGAGIAVARTKFSNAIGTIQNIEARLKELETLEQQFIRQIQNEMSVEQDLAHVLLQAGIRVVP